MPHIRRVDWAGLAAAHASGITLVALAEQSGININTLKARAHRGKWKEAASTALATQAEKEVKAGQRLAVASNGQKVVGNVLAEDSEVSRAAMSKGLRKAAERVAKLSGDEVLDRAQDIKHTTGSLSVIHDWQGSRVQVGVRIDLGRGEVG
jgi:uncharacterized protein YjcR